MNSFTLYNKPTFINNKKLAKKGPSVILARENDVGRGKYIFQDLSVNVKQVTFNEHIEVDLNFIEKWKKLRFS